MNQPPNKAGCLEQELDQTFDGLSIPVMQAVTVIVSSNDCRHAHFDRGATEVTGQDWIRLILLDITFWPLPTF